MEATQRTTGQPSSIDCLPDPAWLLFSLDLIVLPLDLDEPTVDMVQHLWRDALEKLLVPARRVSQSLANTNSTARTGTYFPTSVTVLDFLPQRG